MSTPTEPIVTETVWHIEAYDALGMGVWRHMIKDAQGDSIAQIFGGGTGEQPGKRSYLLAAAPQLLSGLRAARRFCIGRPEADGLALELDGLIALAEGSES